MSMDPDILQDYLPEARELLEQAQSDALSLEGAPNNDDLLASLFRAFHTLKGGAGFLEAEALVAWTHHLEDLLDKLRSHSLPVTSARIDAILQGIDVIHGMLQEMAAGSLPSPGPEALGERIILLASPDGDTDTLDQELTDSPTIPDEHPSSGSEPCPEETLLAIQETSPDGENRIFLERQGEAPALSTPTSCENADEITDVEFEQVLDQMYGGKAPGFVASQVADLPVANPGGAPCEETPREQVAPTKVQAVVPTGYS